ncbi:SPFH domain-containing protein [uncultured Novosphingobium sp.]|uniref:SPFH domain-containing protein n=1 Tax=uncultured Novosphingobium sp. TaxID=292277 RepID=UPI002588C91E|nr:SPFH domain-containing protein [uncultured Novosphingobium sp.]
MARSKGGLRRLPSRLWGMAMALASVVKWNGPASVLAWKFPNEELNTLSSLVVNEAQEAYLFRSGAIDGPYGPGRHVLSTENMPVLTSLYRIPYGGRSPFTAEVWFVNKAVSLDLKWGTVDPLQIMDPGLGVFLPIRSFGQMGVQVSDAKEFLTSLVGTMRGFSHREVAEYFRGSINDAVKTAIAGLVQDGTVNAFQLGGMLRDVADAAHVAISAELARFGLRVVNFYVNSINVPEDDPTVVRVKTAMARKAEMGILGFNYQQERSFDAIEAAAAASDGGAAGAMIGAGLGLGAGLPLGRAIGVIAGNAVGQSSLGSAMSEEDRTRGRIALLRELKALLDEGVLTAEEFAAQKASVLENGR